MKRLILKCTFLALTVIWTNGCSISEESTQSEILVSKYIYETRNCTSNCSDFTSPKYVEICVENDSIYGEILFDNLNDSIEIKTSVDSIFEISYNFNISNNQDSIIDYKIEVIYWVVSHRDTTLLLHKLKFGLLFWERQVNGELQSTYYLFDKSAEIANKKIQFLIKPKQNMVSFDTFMTSNISLEIFFGKINSNTNRKIYLKNI